MNLYIRTAGDDPHARSTNEPRETVCGLQMAGMQQVTEPQALVWLQDRRCSRCFPNRSAHNLYLHRRAA